MKEREEEQERRDLIAFNPETDEIDAKLYENIVNVAGLEKWRLELAGQYFNDVDELTDRHQGLSSDDEDDTAF